MKKVLIVSGLLLLTGCEPNSLQKAQMDYVCNDNGGVYTYSNMLGKTPMVKVKCADGQSFDWSSNQQIPKEFYPKKEK